MYVSKPSFFPLKENIDKLTETIVKYIDYLDVNRELVAFSRANTEEPIYNQSLTELPYLTNCTYSIQREKNTVETIKELLQTKDFYEPISMNKCFPTDRHLHYTFVKKLKENGILIENTILFPQH